MEKRGLLLAFLLWFVDAVPLQAQVNGQDLFRLGMEMLGGAAQNPGRGPGLGNERPSQFRNPSQGDDLRTSTIIEVQNRLNGLGYSVGTADGEAGPRTRQAIADFQRDHGLSPTGQADDRLLQALRIAQPSGSPATMPRGTANAGPSFNCQVVRQQAENTICSSSVLSELDRRLVAAYSRSVSSGVTDARAQSEWLSRRNRCQADAACIEATYRERLSELDPNAGTFAQTTGSAPSGGFTLLDGYDLPYGDYRSGLNDPSLAGIGPQACQQICATDGQCRGFTYNLRGNICILKNTVAQRSRFAGAVSGIKNAGASAGVERDGELARPGNLRGAADFVHMALMSDTDAYLAQADATGVAYMRATGNEAQCRELYQVQHRDEFARRDYLAQAAVMARQVIASLPTRPRRLVVPVEAQYALGEYDFDRQGFPILSSQNSRLPIREAGIVPLLTQQRPPSCAAGMGGFSFDNRNPPNFGNLGAEHPALENVDFLPMSESEARRLREAGVKTVLLKALMSVEPRIQGRGPLRGQITAVAAHDPVDGRLLHKWDIGAGAQTAALDQQGAAWTGELLASLIGPVFEPNRQAFDGAATQYFSRHMRDIQAGNLPPQSPLPIEAMRGRQAEVITSLNRDRLREVLRQDPAAIPLNVAIEEITSPFFEEGRGIYFNRLENSPQDARQPPLTAVNLSPRDLPLYGQLSFLRPWRESLQTGFREYVIAHQSIPIALELDRVVGLEPVAMGIEAAAARGLVGYSSSSRRDNVKVRWDLSVNEVRREKDLVVISASLRGLSYRWASDDRPLASFTPETFPTVAALRGQVEAALPPRATASNVATPPAGTPFGAEMMDLLQLRYQPQTADDQFIQRMMMTRFAYERSMESPPWGRFFRDETKWPGPEGLKDRLAEFRAWSQARAAALPATLTISLPLFETAEGAFAPFESRGRSPHENSCRTPLSKTGSERSEKDVSGAKICEFLNAAWQSPEPMIFNSSHSGVGLGPRDYCAADPYCGAIRDARHAIGPLLASRDLIQLDKLPKVDAAHRRMRGKFAVEIDVRPTGTALSDEQPDNVWNAALKVAAEFDKSQGLNIVNLRRDGVTPTQSQFFSHEASAVAARLVNLDTREVVADLPLATVPKPSTDGLVMPESRLKARDLLGIRLGMSFDEADKIIREHMQVGKLLTADRKKQLASVSGEFLPYTSGRIYASSANNELIAIFDEPPAAPGKVLGMWRIFRMPRGSSDGATVKTTLVERYGEPRSVQEVQLPMMKKGIAFLWSDYADPGCRVVGFGFQADLWRDENGANWLPPFMYRPMFPILESDLTFGILGNKLTQRPLSEFCTNFLGVRYAVHDGTNADSPAGDEILSWLSDHRAYAKWYYQSRGTPASSPSAADATSPKIKF